MNESKYTVIKDTREKHGWWFPQSSKCEGTKVDTMKTGDYTLVGMEDILCIERKASTGEFSQNISQPRFDKEFERMRDFKYSFLLLEFTLDDIMDFPRNSGIPVSKRSKLRISPYFILKRLIDFEVQYPTKIILCGTRGKEIASSIFKRVMENE